jgi:3'-5' exonuclease
LRWHAIYKTIELRESSLFGKKDLQVTKKIFLDIETLPPDKEDPLIRDRAAQCPDEEFRKMALNGAYGRLLCIGLVVEQDGQIIHRGVYGRDRATLRFHLDEARILRSFWNLVRNFNQQRDLFVGFNILDFDLLFLCQRSVIKQIKPSIDICFARFRSQPIYDVMWEFTHWRYGISLDNLAKALGLESSKQDGIEGGRVYDYFLEGRHQEIANYCLRDVDLTRLIYYRMKFLDCSQSLREARCDG